MSEEIHYIKTFNPETKFVPEVISDLKIDLEKSLFQEEDTMEIILAVDEAITNAILESAKSISHKNPVKKDEYLTEMTVTVSWSITDELFSFTVIDKGEGLDIDYMVGKTPSPAKTNFLENLQTYEKKDNLTLRVNGNTVPVKRFGAGLKIMISFMDKITIDYIDRKVIVADKISQDTEGTILNMIRYRGHNTKNLIKNN
jgi:anti-sigma regulatory factor (Ser/Thr protein kinase)